MAPPSWATAPQLVLLTNYLPLYEAYHASTKRYQPFWDTINAAFLQEFPILPDGVTPESLNETEFAEYSAKLAKLYLRIKEWYRWRTNTRSRNTSYTVTPKEMKDIYASGTRGAKEYEGFVKQYPDIFLPAYEAECANQGAEGRARLSIWHKIAKELWAKATDEQKEAVQSRLNAAKQAMSTEEQGPSTPAEYQKYWEKLPAILSKTVNPAVRKAGVLALVTIVGPVPDAGGQILATSLQFGDKPDTPIFSNTWLDHDRVFIDQLAAFAGRYEFSPELCAKRSILHTQKEEEAPSGSGSGSDPAKEPTASLDVGHDDNLEVSSKAGADETVPLESSGLALTEPANAQPQPLPDANLANKGTAPQSSDLSTSTASSFNDIVDTDADPFDLSKFDDNWFNNPAWADPNIFDKIMSSNVPDAHDSSLPAGLTGPLNIHAPALVTNDLGTPLDGSAPALGAPTNAPAVSGPSPLALQGPAPTTTLSGSAPPVPGVSSLPPNQESNLSPSLVAPPTHAPALYPAPAPGAAATVLPAEQGAVGPPVTAPPSADTSVTVPPKAAIGPVLTTPHTSPPALNASLATPLAFQARNGSNRQQNVEKLRGFAGNKENAPPGQPPGPHTPATTTTTSATLQDATQAGVNTSRRSRRAPVPSTRLEKLNEIGTNVVPPKPPIVPVSETDEPSWFAPAYKYLKENALGVAWVELVEKWAEYERSQGWKSGKGLPAKGRPEEWQKWVSKARHGIRNYSNIPNVEDAADLGIAVETWVRSFTTPDFCRTGPHGMVVLLTMMACGSVFFKIFLSVLINPTPIWEASVLEKRAPWINPTRTNALETIQLFKQISE
ncbi:hypothetical protein MD484_g5746, partial [Candolleomyces efflorescens]